MPLTIKLSDDNLLIDVVTTNVQFMEFETTEYTTLLCKGDTLNYDFQNKYNAYSWSSGGDLSYKKLISPAIETVAVTNKIGCKGKRYIILKEQKHLLKVRLDNSTFTGYGRNMEVLKIVNNKPVVAYSSNQTNKGYYNFYLEKGIYYLRAGSYYSNALILKNATMVPVINCFDSTTIDMTSIKSNSNYHQTTNITGTYHNGSCSSPGLSGIRVLLLDSYFNLEYGGLTTTNANGLFTFGYKTYYDPHYLLFDDYPNEYKLFTVNDNTQKKYFGNGTTIIDCNLVTSNDQEILTNQNNFQCLNIGDNNLKIDFISQIKSETTISLLSINGAVMKVVYKDIPGEGVNSIITSIEEFVPGIYICSYKNDLNNSFKKIIVMK